MFIADNREGLVIWGGKLQLRDPGNYKYFDDTFLRDKDGSLLLFDTSTEEKARETYEWIYKNLDPSRYSEELMEEVESYLGKFDDQSMFWREDNKEEQDE